MRHTLAALSLIVWVLSATGCPIVITCEDTGCPGGQVCDIASGVCTDILRDCRTLDICRPGEVCDEESGECRPERLRCTQSFTCPEGQSCNASSGFCEPAFRCESNADCTIAEECNTATQECEPRDCAADTECPVGYVCNDAQECAAGCRPGADGCPQRQFCAVLTGDSIGACVPNCRADEDCPFGQFCDLTDAPDSRCVSEGPCTVDADCRLDEICADSNCVQPPCVSDADCLQTQVCDTATRACRGAQCAEDEFGAGTVSNHARQTAFTLDFGTYTQLVLCDGRSDWFALPVRGTDIVRVRLAQHSDEVDFDIFVFDEQGNPLVSNQQLAQISSLKFAAGREQVVYIEIRATGFGGGMYDLSLADEVCANDTFEENDALEEATVVPSSVGVPSELALRSCGFDEDWFRIRQNDPTTGLRVERVTSTADLFVEVLTPDGERFVVQDAAPFTALRAGVAGSTYVRAVGRLGQTGNYRLAFEILSPWSCVGAGGHATPSTAVVATPQAVLTESICPLDGAWEVDWVELTIDEAGILDLVLRPVGDAPPYEAVLWAGDGVNNVLVRTAVVEGDAARLQAQVEPTSRWFVRVSSSANVGRVLSEPGYTIEYTVQ